MGSASCSHYLEGDESAFQTNFEESDSKKDASLFVHDESGKEDGESESSDEEELV